MSQIRLNGQNGLYDNLIDLTFKFVDIFAFVPKPIVNSLDRALMPARVVDGLCLFEI